MPKPKRSPYTWGDHPALAGRPLTRRLLLGALAVVLAAGLVYGAWQGVVYLRTPRMKVITTQVDDTSATIMGAAQRPLKRAAALKMMEPFRLKYADKPVLVVEIYDDPAYARPQAKEALGVTQEDIDRHRLASYRHDRPKKQESVELPKE